MLPDLCVRSAVAADAHALAGLIADVCADPAVRAFWEAHTKMPPFDAATDCAVVAEQRGEVIGVAAWAQDETVGVITGVAVRKDRRRFGVASAMLAAVVDRLRADGLRVLDASVDAQLPGASRLFERAGFRALGRFHISTEEHGAGQPAATARVYFERHLGGRRSRK